MTTTELGQKVGKSQSTISDIETGKVDIKAKELFLFAEALGVSVYWLLTETDDENHNIAEETGLSNKTINKIKRLNQKQKTLLELLVNDTGRVLSETDYKKNPDLEPEKGFMDALADYASNPMGNRVVEIRWPGKGTEEDPYVEQIIPAPSKYKIQLADGSLHEVSEWMPNGKIVTNRLKAIRRRYLNTLTPMQYISVDEEDDEE